MYIDAQVNFIELLDLSLLAFLMWSIEVMRLI